MHIGIRISHESNAVTFVRVAVFAGRATSPSHPDEEQMTATPAQPPTNPMTATTCGNRLVRYET